MFILKGFAFLTFFFNRRFNYFFFWLNFIFKIKIFSYNLLYWFNWNAFFRLRLRGLNVSYIHNTWLVRSWCILFSHIHLYYFIFYDLFLRLSLLNNWFTWFFLFFWLLRLWLWLLLLRLRFIWIFVFFYFHGFLVIPKISYKFSQMLKKMLIFICCILRKLLRIILMILWNHLFIK